MKGKKLSVLGVSLIISFLIYIVYLVSGNILLNYGMEFRESVIEFIAWDKFVFVIMLNILIIRIIMKRKKIGKEMKLFFTLISFFISAIITFIFVLAPYILISRVEALAYKEGRLVVAASSDGLHDSRISFYEPINSIVMKNSDIEDIHHNAPNNCYYYGKSNFLENPDFDIREEYNFEDLKPWSAKEKFSHEVFNYLGNQTYDFGGIVIKFNKKETWVKEASIERNIVNYEGVNIIGGNIDTIKENISKAEKDHDDSTIYEEFLDEKGNRNVRIGRKYRFNTEDEYRIYYYDTTLVLNDNGIVTSVKYLNRNFEDID
ncbi:ABC transporter permease [Clostridium perfringens]|uniref:ABC transporter permease n=1 Tax=Clostridium perfringens TaxID=1502 RepID=UPI000DA3E849|nr:ABC transporter permease [Clostridium perfringens]EHA1005847.1 ABC transporter permease [Clostridium perfringens]EHA1008828.1 ABC transporter permease [Clostridium perfringens]EHA1020817.1 ABC transporter permease [Clostridium perfringens]MBI5987293.1 ABC transporter permease [Clostridium perfringens]MDK0599074.1 ABC transporter permease [Clostridium perfringens]